MGSNDTSMKIEYRITEDDYAAIARVNAWRRLIARPSTNQLVAGALIGALSGIWLWKDPRAVPALACLVAILMARGYCRGRRSFSGGKTIIYSMPVLFHIVPKSTAREGFDIPRLVQLLAERVGPER
jgi:hypothetical protein